MSVLRRLSVWGHLDQPQRWWMGAVKGYFDDSRSEAFAMAGYVGTDETWDAFDLEWRKTLGHFDFFHTADFHAKQPPYEGLSPDQEIGLVRALADAIGIFGRAGLIKGFGVVVPKSSLRQFNTDRGEQWSPEALSLFVLNAQMQSTLGVGTWEARIDRMERKGQARQALADAEILTQRLGKFDFGAIDPLPNDGSISAKNIPAMQAADLLAWEIRKDYENKIEFYRQMPTPDIWAPNHHNELTRWFLKNRMAKSKELGKPLAVPFEPRRRSWIALDMASVNRHCLCDYATICGLHDLMERA